VLAVFFKTGPFSWNGVMGFWIPVILFVVGMTVTMVLLLQRARYEQGLETAAVPAPETRTDPVPATAAVGAA